MTCKQCGAAVVTPDGNSDALGCACCPQPHSHEAHANGCPGAGAAHAGAACPEPDEGAACVAVTGPGEPCPGEHCGLGVDGCQVCRPCEISFMGAAPVRMG